MPLLENLARIAGLKSFGGTIIYRKSLNTSNQNKLQLGVVAETAEVTLNRKNLGVKWWGENNFDIADALIDGKNHLEIKAITLLF